MVLPVNLKQLHLKASGFDDIINSKEKALNIFKVLVTAWRAEKGNFNRVGVAEKKSRFQTATSNEEWMKKAQAFFNDIYEQLSGGVERDIEEKERNKLKNKFTRAGRNYKKDIIEEEVVFDSRTGITTRRWVKKGEKLTTEFEVEWQNSYFVNKEAVLRKDRDFREVNHYWGRTNHIYKMYNGDDEWETGKVNGFEMGGNPEKNRDGVPCYRCNKLESIKWWYRRQSMVYYCDECWYEIPDCFNCKIKKVWDRTKKREGKEFCSWLCLNKWLEEKDRKNSFKPITKQQHFQVLVSLPGWELLTEDEKDSFKETFKNGSVASDWQKVINQAKTLTAQRRRENGEEEEDDRDGEHQLEINQAIAEVESVLRDNDLEKDYEKIKVILGSDWEGQIRNSANLMQVRKLKNTFIQKIEDFVAQSKSNISDAVKEIEEILRKVGLSENILEPNWKDFFQGKNETEMLAELERLKRIIIANGGKLSEVISISKIGSINRIKNKLKEGHEKLAVQEEELPSQLLIPYKTVEAKINSLEGLEDITSFENKLRNVIIQKRQEKLVRIADEAIAEIKEEIGQDQGLIELGEYRDYETKLKSMNDPDIIDLVKKNIISLIREQKGGKSDEGLRNINPDDSSFLNPKTLGIIALIIIPLGLVGFVILRLWQRKSRQRRH